MPSINSATNDHSDSATAATTSTSAMDRKPARHMCVVTIARVGDKIVIFGPKK